MKKFNLSKQLLCIMVVIFLLLTASIGYLLPTVLLPVYEDNIYTMLKQPLEFVSSDVRENSYNSNVAYLYISKDSELVTSVNLNKIIKLSPKQIIKKIDKLEGKFTYLGKNYYYIQENDKYIKKIALTNDTYINEIKDSIISTILPIIFFTMLIVLGLVLLWSQILIMKIENLKEKVDNLDNDNYNKKFNYYFDDELYSLSLTIDDMKATLKEQDEYKNQMYQNISHDFKTPLTVIKSYIEGIEDGIQDKDQGFKVIKEQVNKLEMKVHSLLYLNKLNYLKEKNNYKDEKTDVSRVIDSSVEKFKSVRPDVKWEVIYYDNKLDFRGTFDMWEAIIDNLLANFTRYAKKEIKITIKNGKITLYNDGPNIDPNILNNIFSPYKKGIKGQFGLGLSIVKKTIHLFGYEITVNNEKNGISFIIK